MSFEANLVSALQARLAELGYYRLRVDGLPGPGTSEAVIRFKQAHSLRTRGFVGQVADALTASVVLLAKLSRERSAAWDVLIPEPFVRSQLLWSLESAGNGYLTAAE